MQQYSYLTILIMSVLVPLAYSFHPKMKLIRWWKTILLSITITAIPFIIWDFIFTKFGIWSFNPSYHVSFKLLYLPIEEWLFFWAIPYASIFTHYALRFYTPNFKLTSTATKIIGMILLIIALSLAVIYYQRWYTFVNFSLFSMVLGYGLFSKQTYLQSFFPSFIIVLIPFLAVNGILTGSFNFDAIVLYDNSQNLGFRIFNIPMEDFVYAFSLLFSSILLIEYFNPIEKQLTNDN